MDWSQHLENVTVYTVLREKTLLLLCPRGSWIYRPSIGVVKGSITLTIYEQWSVNVASAGQADLDSSPSWSSTEMRWSHSQLKAKSCNITSVITYPRAKHILSSLQTSTQLTKHGFTTKVSELSIWPNQWLTHHFLFCLVKWHWTKQCFPITSKPPI